MGVNTTVGSLSIRLSSETNEGRMLVPIPQRNTESLSVRSASFRVRME